MHVTVACAAVLVIVAGATFLVVATCNCCMCDSVIISQHLASISNFPRVRVLTVHIQVTSGNHSEVATQLSPSLQLDMLVVCRCCPPEDNQAVKDQSIRQRHNLYCRKTTQSALSMPCTKSLNDLTKWQPDTTKFNTHSFQTVSAKRLPDLHTKVRTMEE